MTTYFITDPGQEVSKSIVYKPIYPFREMNYGDMRRGNSKKPLLLFSMCLFVASCEPEILSGTYYCGAERFCPPEFACDGETYTCLRPDKALDFECPSPSIDSEPNSAPEGVTMLGSMRCGGLLGSEEVLGCIESQDDIDVFEFDYDVECASDSQSLAFELTYPIAFMPIQMTLVDDLGSTIESATSCTPELNNSGKNSECIELMPQPRGITM